MAEERPWYFRDRNITFALMALLVVALPMVWLNPYYSLRRKLIITVIVGIATYFSYVWTQDAFKMVNTSLDMMK